MAETAYDNLKSKTFNNPALLDIGVTFPKGDEPAATPQVNEEAVMAMIQSMVPGADGGGTQMSAGNLFVDSTAPLYEGMARQSIGRMLGDMPTSSDKKIMYRLMDYLPEKSKAMGHAVMANVVNSLRGDQQAGAIAAKLLDDKNTFDTKINALQFGIHKLADPDTSDEAKGSIMAALRNNWDDIYGPDKSVKMAQSMGFLAQVGSIMEALMAKAQLATSQSNMARYGGGEVADPFEVLNKNANTAMAQFKSYAETQKNLKKDYDPKTDDTYKRYEAQVAYWNNRLKDMAVKYYGNAKEFSILDNKLPDLGYSK
jgi:hypothetical protein